MNKITSIAFAGAFGLLGLACGLAAPAWAQVDPGVKVTVGGTAGVTDGTIADRTRENWVGQTYGTLLGRDTKGGSLGSLASVGSVDNLFPLSRGDNGTQPSHGTDHVKQFNGNGGIATGGAGPRVNPGAAKGPVLANQGGNAANGNAGSTKGITVAKTPR